MPIEERSPRECAERFRAHLSELLSATIAPKVPLRWMPQAKSKGGGAEFAVVFQQGNKPSTIPLQTHYGRLFFHLAQLVEAEKIGKHFRLRTLQYWYRLQATGGLLDAALLRWEYERNDPTIAGPPRHHLQAPATLAWGAQSLDLDKLHTPSGWVMIEELIRFLIAELGAVPVSDEWPKVLAASEDRFFQEFSSKRRRSGAS